MGNPWLFIEEGTDITAVDPDLNVEPGITAPTATQPGPDRITIWVPKDEESLINLGEHFPGPTSTTIDATPHTLDAGIAGRTIRHVHLHTMGDEDEGEIDHKRTIVRLGLPTISVEARDTRKSARQLEVETELANLDMAQISAYVGLGIVTGPFAALAADKDVGGFNQRRRDLEDELRRLEDARLRAGESRDAIGTVIPHVHRDFGGYSMLTRGTAAQEARQAHLIISNENDVRAVGQTSVSIGSPGDVFIIADQQADMTSLCGFESNPTSRPFSYWNDRVTSGLSLVTTLASTIFADVIEWVQISQGVPKKPIEGASGWIPTGSVPMFVLKALLMKHLGALKSIFAFWAMTDFASGDSDEAGANAEPRGDLAHNAGFGSRLGIYSSGSLKIVADKNAGMSSKFYTSVSADQGLASVSGGMYAGLSSPMFTAISGTWTTLTGKHTIGIEAQFGDMTMRSRLSAELSSNHAKVTVTGKQEAQLNSTDAAAFLHGKTGFYAGAGVGGGWGIQGTPSGIKMGQMNTAGNFKQPGPNDSYQIAMSQDGLTIKHGNNELKMEGGGFTMKRGSAKFTLNDSSLQIDGSRIQIGG